MPLGRRGGSHTQGSSLTRGRGISWNKKGGFRGLEESVAPFCGRQDTVRSIQVVCATALHAPGRDKCLPVRWGLDAEQGVWRADPEKGLVLPARRQPENGREELHNGMRTRESPGCHRSKAALFNAMQREESPLDLCPHMPVASTVGTSAAPAGVGWCGPGCHLWPLPLGGQCATVSHCLCPLLPGQAHTPLIPSHLRGLHVLWDSPGSRHL